MFKREIWDKLTKFTFLKFVWNEGDFKISKINEVNFPQISRINMWFLVNVTSSQRAHKGKNYTKNNQSISTNLINITQ